MSNKINISITSILTLLGMIPIISRAHYFPTSEEMHEIRVNFADAGHWETLYAHYASYLETGKSQYMVANISIDGETLDSVGFRMKGQYSNYGFPGSKKPFKIDFNEFRKGQNFNGLKKLNLHNFAGDPSFMRDHISYYILREQGVVAPQTAFTKLYLNDVFWGVYLIVEQVDSRFLETNFALSNGNLFKCMNDTEMQFDSLELKENFELKTNKDENNWSAFYSFVHLFNHPFDFNYYTKLNHLFDLDTYFKVLAIDVLLDNWDSYAVNGRNFYLYEDPENGKFVWIPWDYNLSLWEKNIPVFPQISSNVYAPLIKSIMNNVHLRSDYLTVLCETISNLAVEDIQTYVLETYDLIKTDVYSDKGKFYSNLAFDENIYRAVEVEMIRNKKLKTVYLPGVLEKINQRRQAIFQALSPYPDACGIPEKNEQIHTYPNPSDGNFTLLADLLSPSKGMQLMIFNGLGELVFQEHLYNTGKEIQLNTQLKSGQYLLKAFDKERELTTKIIVY